MHQMGVHSIKNLQILNNLQILDSRYSSPTKWLFSMQTNPPLTDKWAGPDKKLVEPEDT